VTGASERYLRLTKLAQRAFSHGQLERALRLFTAAEEEAKRLGDRELADRAFCNRCVVLLELERLDDAVGELKHVLIRSRDPFTSWMAAYYTAQVYEAEGNVARALAYARRATELAETSGELRARAASANQHGVLALKDSHFSEAGERFQEALQLAAGSEKDPIATSIMRDNLGYCLMCTGSLAEGLALCVDAAGTLERVGARQFLGEVYQDLCYGALLENDFTKARDLGAKALALAHEYENAAVERNTLMLLADAALDGGDEDVANGYLESLAAHYPDFQGMKDFLRAFNVREVINLKA
jgi:tetratricopeptide (TPR) repeat protein